MENKMMAKQIIDFHKATFDNTFNALTILQEQTEKMVHTFLAQANWLPAEGRKAINDWVEMYKKGRVDFKAAADKNFKKVEEYFIVAERESKVKETKKK